jgi:hypothetical protein
LKKIERARKDCIEKGLEKWRTGHSEDMYGDDWRRGGVEERNVR